MSHPAVKFIPDLEEVTRQILAELRPGDVLLVLSAGDADRVSAGVLAELKGELQK
jgi:UDP-N-acetylmuramate-alanine ligase